MLEKSFNKKGKSGSRESDFLYATLHLQKKYLGHKYVIQKYN